MSSVDPFLQGVLIAVGLIIPLGPQNTFVFNQAIKEKSLLRAMPVAWVAASCDTLLILLAVLGVSAVLQASLLIKPLVMAIGVIFLTFFAIKIWREVPVTDLGKEAPTLSFARQAVYAISVSILNPHAILDCFLVIGSLSAEYQGVEKAIFSSACIGVSFIWFMLLSACGYNLKKLSDSGSIIRWVNRLSALIMIYLASRLFRECLADLIALFA